MLGGLTVVGGAGALHGCAGRGSAGTGLLSGWIVSLSLVRLIHVFVLGACLLRGGQLALSVVIPGSRRSRLVIFVRIPSLSVVSRPGATNWWRLVLPIRRLAISVMGQAVRILSLITRCTGLVPVHCLTTSASLVLIRNKIILAVEFRRMGADDSLLDTMAFKLSIGG